MFLIIIHLFYKAPFKALKVAVQHFKNSSKDGHILKAEQFKSKAVCSRATITGNTSGRGRPQKVGFENQDWVDVSDVRGGSSRGEGQSGSRPLTPWWTDELGGQSGRWRRPTGWGCWFGGGETGVEVVEGLEGMEEDLKVKAVFDGKPVELL